MDVNPPTSHSKRVAASPPPSLPEKYARILLPDDQLDALQNHMKHMSDLMNWRTRTKEPKDNDVIWRQIHSMILVELIAQLRATDMKRVVIPNPTLPDAWNYFENFNEEELEQWKDGVENGVEKDDWSSLLEHRALYFLLSDIAFNRHHSETQNAERS